MGVGKGAGEEGGGGECGWRGNLLKSSSQAKSGESVGHHHTFAMGSSAISMLNMVYLVLNFCVLHLFLDNRMQPLYLFLLADRTLLKWSASRFSDIAFFFFFYTCKLRVLMKLTLGYQSHLLVAAVPIL